MTARRGFQGRQMQDDADTETKGVLDRRRERLLLLMLASVQFTSIVDFMVVMPLGPQLQRVLGLDEAQFGGVVAAYTVAAGLAEAVAIGERIWSRGVEKVLACRESWLQGNPEPADRLLPALARAAAWCDDPGNREALADLLASSRYIDQPAHLIERALSGQIIARADDPPVSSPDFMLFGREASSFPWRSQALWIYSQLVRWGMVAHEPAMVAKASAVFRPDIYRRALANSGVSMPGASMKVEGAVNQPLPVGSREGKLTLGPDRFFDGRVFDPEKIDDYLAGFASLR